MTTPVLPDYAAPFKPVPNVTPFTLRDGTTMLKKIDYINKYIDRVLIPWINENFSELADEFETQVNALLLQVNAALATQSENVENDIAALETYVNEQVQLIINDSIQVQDPVVTAIIGDVDSDTRAILDTTYATKSVQTIVESGRLSSTNLDTTYATKSVQTTVESGRLSSTNNNANIDSRSDARIPITGKPIFAQINRNIKLGSRFALLADSNGLSPFFDSEGGKNDAVRRRGETWFSTASIASGGKIRAAINASVAGQTMLELLNRFDADLGARASEWDTLVLLGGSNSINDGVPTATIISQAEQIINKALMLGKAVVLCAKLPSGEHSNRVGGRKLNFYYERLANKYQIPFIDWYTLLIDPATADWRYAADHIDSQHLSLAGVNKAGKFFATQLAPHLIDSTMVLPRDNIDTTIMRNSSSQPFNHLWYIDADSSGMPDGYSLGGSAGASTTTYAIDPTFDADAYSIKIEGTLSTSTARTISCSYSNVSGAWTPGDLVQAAIKLKYVPTTVPTVNPPISTTQRVEIDVEAVGSTEGHVFWQQLYAAHDGVVISEPMTIPPGTTALAFRVKIYGGPVIVQVSRMTLRNLTVQNYLP